MKNEFKASSGKSDEATKAEPHVSKAFKAPAGYISPKQRKLKIIRERGERARQLAYGSV